jgi:branched-chain amino acid aminotransferase
MSDFKTMYDNIFITKDYKMTLSFDQMDGWIWMNGKMVEWKSAKTHVLAHGLHYGGSVFEGIRIYNGKIFKLREHKERLIISAEIIGMPIAQSCDELCNAVEETVQRNNLVDGYIRPLAWRGAEELGIGATKCSTQVMVACWPWGKYFGANEGISLCTSSWKKPAPDTAVTAAKTGALYVVNTMAKHEAIDRGYSDALMMDYRGYVAEISAANIFMIKNGILSTPIPDCFLNGITRLTTIDLAKQSGIEVQERRIMPDELMDADEIFITGTLAEVTSVIKIDDKEFKIGKTTQRLIDLYQQATFG